MKLSLSIIHLFELGVEVDQTTGDLLFARIERALCFVGCFCVMNSISVT